MKNYLLITLGHNSSAIFVQGASCDESSKPMVIGYEEERLSRIKADSQFPYDAIKEIEFNVGREAMANCRILVSHWFNFTGFEIPNKYITLADINYLKGISEDIKFVDEDFTHHDAHAYSAYAFRDYFTKQAGNIPVFCIVADGFGNNEEVFSIYRRDAECKPELINRIYNPINSLGLFYQYATSFVGMKENQDEYKFLGYEAHIEECFINEAIIKIAAYSDVIVEDFKKAFADNANKVVKKMDDDAPFCSFEKLKFVKQYWHKIFTEAIKEIGIPESDANVFEARVAIAFLIQRTVEKILLCVIASYGMKHICLAGGLFYNVKLNNAILEYVNSVDGTLSIMPLAGDQGAAIGMYAAEDDVQQFPFNTLAIGIRRLYNIEKYADNVFNIPSSKEESEELASQIAKYIADNRIVDIIFGNMEFGPRALCNTSSIFLPRAELTAENNANNLRNEVMPCAPICTNENASKLFNAEELNRVIGSDRFMICTHTYEKPYSRLYAGAMHEKTLSVGPDYTGRPQIVKNGSFMWHILNAVERICDAKCLVNTSFNVHGNPIVFDSADIISNYKFQCEHAKMNGTEKPILIIIK